MTRRMPAWVERRDRGVAPESARFRRLSHTRALVIDPNTEVALAATSSEVRMPIFLVPPGRLNGSTIRASSAMRASRNCLSRRARLGTVLLSLGISPRSWTRLLCNFMARRRRGDGAEGFFRARITVCISRFESLMMRRLVMLAILGREELFPVAMCQVPSTGDIS